MRLFFSIVFVLILKSAANAQSDFQFNDDLKYAVIKDADGFVNVRKSPGNQSPIIGKIVKYSVFGCETSKSDWWKILYIKYDDNHKSSWLEGYVYKNRVLLLTKWIRIKEKNI